ncbi:hypothetical protein VP1G_05345, partial [Cytospora mali]
MDKMDTEAMVSTIHDALSKCLGAHISHVNLPSGFDLARLEAYLQEFTTKEISALVKIKENGSEMTDIELMVVALRASISDWNHSSNGKEYLLDTEWLVDYATGLIDKDIGSTDEAPDSGTASRRRATQPVPGVHELFGVKKIRTLFFDCESKDHFPNCTLKTLQMKVANSKARTAELRQQLQHQEEEEEEE